VRASVSNPLQPDVARRVSGGSNGPKPSETCLPNSPDGVSSGLKLGRVRHPKTQKYSPAEQGLRGPATPHMEGGIPPQVGFPP
jgi:hypothetical protein